jgi:hypothetical protein
VIRSWEIPSRGRNHIVAGALDEDLTEHVRTLQINIRCVRDAAVNAYARAMGRGKRLDGVVIVLSTTTAGSLWFLCASAGPAWLAVTVKWVGAIFGTICAVLTAYKERITNHRKLADDAIEYVRSLEELLGRLEERQTPRSLQALQVEYRDIKAQLSSIFVDLSLPAPTSALVDLKALTRDARESHRSASAIADNDS